MMWMRVDYPVDDNDAVLCRTAISFDAAGWEIWLPLLSGATLCMAPSQLIHDPGQFSRYVKHHGITIARFVPSLLVPMLVAGAPDLGRSLRRVFSGGEPLASSIARDVIAAWTVPLVNLYGPTETTIHITSALRERHGFDVDSAAPIGRPIWNTQVYVLDGGLEPVPAGVSGELYIAGSGLARGMWVVRG